MTSWVMITGASAGIGRALAMQFARKNFKVLAIGRNELALQALKNFSQKITTFTADLTDVSVIPKLKKIFKPGDNIKFFIHCAVSSEPHVPLSKLRIDDFQYIVTLNAYIPLHLTTELKSFYDGTTRVLFMGSDYVKTNGKIRPHIAGAYAISKTALDKGIQYVRAENPNLAIACFNPGSTNTGLLTTMQSAVLHKHGIFNKSSVKIANPKDVAELIFCVLTQMTDSSYKGTNWDFRNRDHHDEVNMKKMKNIRPRL